MFATKKMRMTAIKGEKFTTRGQWAENKIQGYFSQMQLFLIHIPPDC